VRDQHHALQPETGDDRVEVDDLVGEGVVVVGRLVRLALSEEVEHHDVPPGEMGNQAIVEVVVVGEAVHQHDGGSLAALLPHV
jgi:hypothetical protein